MAEVGRRERVVDPLEGNVNANQLQVAIPSTMIRNPGQTGGNALAVESAQMQGALGKLGQAVDGWVAQKKDEWVTDGRIQFMQGATENQINQSGNKYTMQGWQSLSSVDAANRWYAEELTYITGEGRNISPEDYNKRLIESRTKAMQNMPSDPVVRKMYASAFDDLGPRLAAQQIAAHNDYNKEQTENSFLGILDSGSYVNSDAPRTGSNPVPMSHGKVRDVGKYSDADIDQLTRRVMLEAGGDGATAQAAIANIMVNRNLDLGTGLREVSRAGADSAKLDAIDANGPGYAMTRGIIESVVSGKAVDNTNGATEFSRSGDGAKVGPFFVNGRARNLSAGPAPYYTPGMQFPNQMQSTEVRNIAAQQARELGFVGVVPIDGPKYGIRTGSAEEWANLFTGLAYHESGHKNSTVGDVGQFVGGSRGMLQLSFNDARGYGLNGGKDFTKEQLADPVFNMRTGMTIAKNLIEKNGGSIQRGMGKYWGPVSKEGWTPGNGRDRNLPWKEWGNLPAGVYQAGTPSAAQTQTQGLIRGFNLPTAKKAELVAGTMAQQLASGSTALYDNVGGTAFLRELGATPQQIKAVETAKRQYDISQSNKFNMEQATWENDVINRVKSGATSLDEAKSEIQSRYNGGKLDDRSAYALVSRAMNANAAEDRTPNLNPDLMQATADVYAQIRNDPNQYNGAWADGKIRELSKQYNVPPNQLQSMLTKVWSEHESAVQRLEARAEIEARKAAEDQAKRESAKRAMAIGVGLSGLSGTVDGMPLKEYAISTRHEELMRVAKDQIPEYMKSGMSQQEAIAAAAGQADTTLWTELTRQGNEVYQAQANAITAGLTGPLIETGGKVNPSAVNAFNDYKRLKQVDPSGVYAMKYLGTEQAKSAALLIEKFHDGSPDIQTAIRAAAEHMSRTGSAEIQAMQKEVFKGSVAKMASEETQKLLGEGGFLDIYSSSSSLTAAERANAMGATEQGRFQEAVMQNAAVLHAQEPGMDPDVVIKKAASAVAGRTTVVAGNLIIQELGSKQSLPQQMGVEKYKKDAVNDAVRSYLVEQYSNGALAADFQKAYGDARQSWLGKWFGVATLQMGPNEVRRAIPETANSREPKIHVDWNEESGYLKVQLYDPTGKFTVPYEVARPIFISTKDLGAWYKAKESERAAAEGNSVWNRMFNSIPGHTSDPEFVKQLERAQRGDM